MIDIFIKEFMELWGISRYISECPCISEMLQENVCTRSFFLESSQLNQRVKGNWKPQRVKNLSFRDLKSLSSHRLLFFRLKIKVFFHLAELFVSSKISLWSVIETWLSTQLYHWQPLEIIVIPKRSQRSRPGKQFITSLGFGSQSLCQRAPSSHV